VSGELILFTTEDGQSHIQSQAEGGTVWLSGDLELTWTWSWAVGYRVRSHRGTQFRQWATTNLRLMAQSFNFIAKSMSYTMVVS
jgi:hypothetical protein